MTKRLTSKIVALAAAALCTTGAMAAGPQDLPITESPTFAVWTSGPRGHSILRYIDFGNGFLYEQFIYVKSVENFEHEGSPGSSRIVAGPESEAHSPKHRLGNADGNPDDVTSFDRDAFADSIRLCFRNSNLNNCLDNNGSEPYFSFEMTLDRELRDNDIEPDGIGEIIYFDRGPTGANSFMIIEAIDADGNVLGNPLLISPADLAETTPKAESGTFDDDLNYSNKSEKFGAVSIDLSELGVQRVSRLRVRQPSVGELGLSEADLTGNIDLAPDFKLLFIQTYDLLIPDAFLGD